MNTILPQCCFCADIADTGDGRNSFGANISKVNKQGIVCTSSPVSPLSFDCSQTFVNIILYGGWTNNSRNTNCSTHVVNKLIEWTSRRPGACGTSDIILRYLERKKCDHNLIKNLKCIPKRMVRNPAEQIPPHCCIRSYERLSIFLQHCTTG